MMIRCLLVMLLSLAWTGPANAETALTAEQVFARYVDAMGGAEALAAIQSRDIDGQVKAGWLSATTHGRIVRPNTFEDSAKILGLSAGSGYDGTRGWSRKGGDVKPVEGDDLKRAIRGHSLDWNTRTASWYPTMRLLPDSAVDGVAVDCVETISESNDREVWRFDAATGLLKQFEGTAKNDDGKMVPVVANFSDYRRIDGIMLPYRVDGTSDGDKIVVITTKVVHNADGPAIRFPDQK